MTSREVILTQYVKIIMDIKGSQQYVGMTEKDQLRPYILEKTRAST